MVGKSAIISALWKRGTIQIWAMQSLCLHPMFVQLSHSIRQKQLFLLNSTCLFFVRYFKSKTRLFYHHALAKSHYYWKLVMSLTKTMSSFLPSHFVSPLRKIQSGNSLYKGYWNSVAKYDNRILKPRLEFLSVQENQGGTILSFFLTASFLSWLSRC